MLGKTVFYVEISQQIYFLLFCLLEINKVTKDCDFLRTFLSTF